MWVEDQADRTPPTGQRIDWARVAPRDSARLTRVHALYLADRFVTGADHYYAATILQHSDDSSDFLLAHELSVLAIGLGEPRARWLAAASEDRFLLSIGRPQRFGTQYAARGPGEAVRLGRVEEGVTDSLRRAFNAPGLAEARAHEAELNP
jgi:hypothetical protein